MSARQSYSIFPSLSALEADIADNDEKVKRPRTVNDPLRFTNHRSFVNIRLLAHQNGSLWFVYCRKTCVGELARNSEGTFSWYCYSDKVSQKRPMDSLHRCAYALTIHITDTRPHGIGYRPRRTD